MTDDEGSMRWNAAPLNDKREDPTQRARAALHEPMPPTYGEVERRVAKAIQEAEMSIQKDLTIAHEAMQEFCNRVDRGKVRSNRTYAAFKEILEKTGAP